MLPRIGFAGSDDVAAAVLAGLPAVPDWVLTRPPAPKGRGRRLRPTPVGAAAAAAGVRVLTRDPRTRPPPEADLLVVVSYGRILPPEWLTQPLGAINFHPSALPAWRGAAPIERAVMAGAKSVGVCWIRMVEEMDAGGVLARSVLAVGENETGGSLRGRSALAANELLVDLWADLLSSRAVAVAQAGTATSAPRLTPGDRELDVTLPAAALHDLVRALDPLPGARVRWDGGWLAVAASRGVAPAGLAPGDLALADDDLVIGASAGALRVGRVVPQGRGAMSGAEFLRGWPGARLG